MTNYTPIERMATKNQKSYVVQLMTNIFNGEDGRKLMLKEYFGKRSTNDFTYDEICLVIHLLLNDQQRLKDFYANIRKS